MPSSELRASSRASVSPPSSRSMNRRGTRRFVMTMDFAVGSVAAPDRIAEGCYIVEVALGSRAHFSSWIGVIVIVDPSVGVARGRRRVESPNSDERPPGVDPDLIVVHGISLPPGRVRRRLDRPVLLATSCPPPRIRTSRRSADLTVSAHVLDRARRRADAVRPVRPPRLARGQVASTAGAPRATTSRWESSSKEPTTCRTSLRSTSACGGHRAHCAARIRSLREAEVVGHSDIAPGRKTDPGASFDWLRLRRSSTRAARLDGRRR